jgi:hypothetical protein
MLNSQPQAHGHELTRVRRMNSSLAWVRDRFASISCLLKRISCATVVDRGNQLHAIVDTRIENPCVAGSIPVLATFRVV